LYNDQGTSAVTTNHIAESAGISVGNLYYHFANREAIIRALFEWNRSDTLVAFDPNYSMDLSLDTFDSMIRANYRILWRYRFIYRELIVLLRRDPEFAEQFRTHRREAFIRFEALLEAFVQMGVLRRIESDIERGRLAVTVWILSEFYITYLESDADITPDDFMEEGAALLHQTLKPYLIEIRSR